MGTENDTLVICYLKLRRAIGVAALALPIVLILGALIVFEAGLQPSLSDYYHTGMRDVFVGTLFAIGFFLFSYRGYGPADDRAGNLACLCALGAALFPARPSDDGASHTQIILGYIHLGCAALFFLTLAFFSLVLFTRSGPGTTPTPMKQVRNAVYRTCGWVIIGSLMAIAVYFLWLRDAVPGLAAYRPVLILEILAESAFGISWLIKGETLLKDG